MAGPPVAVACPPDDDGDGRNRFNEFDDPTESLFDDDFEVSRRTSNSKRSAAVAEHRLSPTFEPRAKDKAAKELDAGLTPPSGQGEQEHEEEQPAEERTSTDADSFSAPLPGLLSSPKNSRNHRYRDALTGLRCVNL